MTDAKGKGSLFLCLVSLLGLAVIQMGCSAAGRTKEQPNLQAHLVLSPTTLAFTMTLGGGAPPGQTLTVEDTGTGPSNWAASTDQKWCHVAPTSGNTAAGGNSTLTVSVDALSTVGASTCTVTVNDPNADDPSQTASVSYMVNADIWDWIVPYGTSDVITATAVSGDGATVVTADKQVIPGLAAEDPTKDPFYTNRALVLLAINVETGEIGDSWIDKDETGSPMPSEALSARVANGVVLVGGFEGNDGSRQAVVWQVTTNPFGVQKLKAFQLGAARTEIHGVAQDQAGNIWVSVNTDYQQCPSWCTSGDFLVVMDPGGNIERQLPLRTFSAKTSITGMYIGQTWVFASGSVLDSAGQPQTMYAGCYDPMTGDVQVAAIGSSVINPFIYQDDAGEVLIVGTAIGSSSSGPSPQSFQIFRSDDHFNFNLAVAWNGGSNGATLMGATLNQDTLTLVGFCLEGGSSQGCMVSYQLGQTLTVNSSQIFGQGYLPGGSSEGWTSAATDANGNVYLGGWGQGSGCTGACSTAFVGKLK